MISAAWRRWGISPKRRGDEFYAPCPWCGGKDRFVIFAEDGGYFCRDGDGHCGRKGWLDDDKRNFTPDPLRLAKQRERDAQEREERREKIRLWQSGYRAGYWQGYHDAMKEVHRAWWRSKGVTDELQDFYGFGYCANKLIQIGDGEVAVECYTLPTRDPKTWEVTGMHYRLAPGYAEQYGRYRYEYKVPQQAFYALQRTEGRILIVVEGGIKTAVLKRVLKPENVDAQIVGLPSAQPSHYVLDEVASLKFKQRYLVLDPGANGASEKVAHAIGGAKVVTLPCKPDDAFLQYGLTLPRFREYLLWGRIVR